MKVQRSITCLAVATISLPLGLPSNADDTKSLRATTTETSPAAINDEGGRVESFFQIDSKERNRQPNLLMQPGTVQRPAEQDKKSALRTMYRFGWHVLDNAGVPMFFGQDRCVDPSISGTYVIPAPKIVRDHASERQPQEDPKTVAQPCMPTTTSQPAPQKIPESELEGITLPTLK